MLNTHGKNLFAPAFGLCSVAAVTLTAAWLGAQLSNTRSSDISAAIATPSQSHSPVYFEPNMGQADARIDYLSRGLDHALYLSRGDAIVALHDAAVRISARGRHAAPTAVADDTLASKSHYLHGIDSRQWRPNIPNYRRVRYEQVYPGIDLVYYGSGSRLEYDFVVAPGADPAQIALTFDGADAVTIRDDGALHLEVGGHTLIQHMPVIYQLRHGRRQPVAGHYIYSEGGAIGLQLAAYDADLPLVIDPVLDYSTFFGGSSTLDVGATSAPVLGRAGDDRAYAVAVDASGNIYVAGTTTAGNFPATAGAYDTHCGTQATTDCNNNNAVSITAVRLPSSVVTVSVTDPDLNTNAASTQTVNVPVVNGSTGESETLVLIESGTNTGVFVATLPVRVGTAAGGNDDGTLIVRGGETISARYADAQTSSGGAATLVATTLVPQFTVMAGPLTAPGNNLTIIVKDALLNVNTAATDTGFVRVTNDTTGETEEISVSETAVDSDVFTASLATTPGASAGANSDGTLNIQNGHQLTVDYPTPITVTLDEAGLALTDPLDVANNDANAVETVTVSITNARTGEAEAVTLTETGIDTALFFGRLATQLAATTGTSNSGVMLVQSGDTFAAADSLTVTNTARTISASTIPAATVANRIALASVTLPTGGSTVEIASVAAPGDIVTITVADTDLNIDSSATETTTVTVTNDRTGESEAIAITETGANTGIFSAALATASASGSGIDDDGILNVTSADILTAVYADARTGAGVAATVTSTGTVGGFSSSTTSDLQVKADAFIAKFDTGGQLVYSTFLGGNSADGIRDIAVDGSGNVYAAGTTLSTDFPATGGVFDGAVCPDLDDNGMCDRGERIFVIKLNNAGAALTWSTFLGYGTVGGIAVNANGEAHITGSTSGTFATQGPYQAQYGGGASDVFVTKINSTGTALSYSTHLGGSGPDYGRDIALNSAGTEAYVAGYTFSSGFPTTVGVHDTSCGFSGTCNNNGSTLITSDAFIARFNATGNGLLFSTFLGGSNADYANSVAVDASGNVYVAGQTTSADFPITAGTFSTDCDHDNDGRCDGGAEAFVTKLASGGGSLSYSTYLGGGATDSAESIAVDASGNAFLAGSTYSTSFPDTAPAFDVRATRFPGDFINIIVRDARLNASGNAADRGALVVVNDTTNESEAVFLSETGSNNGIFTATLRSEFGSASGVANDRKLQVLSGTNLTLRYAEPLTITVTDPASNTSTTQTDTFAIDITNGRTPETEAVTLRETGASTGVFTAVLPVAEINSAGTDNDGILHFQTGDTFSSSFTPAPVVAGATFSETTTAVFGTNAVLMTNAARCTANIATPGSACPAGGFVMKLNPTGTGVDYTAFLAGNGNDYPMALALDATTAAPTARLAVAGFSNSAGLPVTANAYQAAHGDLSNDDAATNNDAFIALFVDTDADLQLTDDASDTAGDPNNTTATSRSMTLGSNIAMAFGVTNNGATAIDGVVLSHSLAAPYDSTSNSIKDGASRAAYVSAIPSVGSCTLRANTVTCELGRLAANETATVTVTATPQAVGTFRALSSVKGYGSDSNLRNNVLASDITVNAPLVTSATSGSTGNGGGALGWMTLSMLLFGAGLRGLRRRASKTSGLKRQGACCATLRNSVTSKIPSLRSSCSTIWPASCLATRSLVASVNSINDTPA